MSATKAMWMDEVEAVGERVCLGPEHYRGLSKDDGVKRLVRLGFDKHEAETMLDEAMA